MENAIPKIEGHAAFYTHLKNGQVDKARMIGLENDRFVEKILFGKKYWEAPIITSRICGICPTIHSTTSIQAIERACDITPTKQTVKLRQLMLAAQMIQSHSLHLYLLSAPDFLGVGSSFELQKSHPALFEFAIKLKHYADNILEVIGGRAVHQISDVPGGFKKLPEMDSMRNLIKQSDEIIDISLKTIQLFAKFHVPDLSRETIYSALTSKKYNIYEGNITTTDNQSFSPEQYHDYIYEELKPYTRAKFGTMKGHVMNVGSIARMKLNYEQMHSEAVKITNEINFDFNNPFNNNLAQAIEMYHFSIETKKILEEIVKDKIDYKEIVKKPKKFGKGVGVCEAPRGTLYHFYELDEEGSIIDCDIITPTVQSLSSMEKDMLLLGPIIENMDKEEQNKIIEILIRAYDPCITCATH